MHIKLRLHVCITLNFPVNRSVLFCSQLDTATMSGRTLRSAANSAAAKISQATTSAPTPPKPAPKRSSKNPPPKTTTTTTAAPKLPPNPPRTTTTDPPTLLFPTPAAFDTWLATHGTTTPAGLFLQITKKSAPGPASLTYDQAVDTALCHGWIDGQRRALSATAFLQRFTPRRKRSVWSARNVAKVGVLEAEGRMKAEGRREVEEARGDGRWEAAYGGGGEVRVPRELEGVLEGNERARRGWEALGRSARAEAVYRIGSARREETRKRRVEEVVEGLERGVEGL